MTRFVPRGPLGFGAAPLGNLFSPISDAEAQGALEAAWDSGIRFFDTAPMYGLGLSEHRVGRMLRQKPREHYTLSTKVGRLLEPDAAAPDEQFGFVDALKFRVRFDYSADAARRSIEDSLQRLGLGSIDVVLIHDIGEDTHGAVWRQRFDEAMVGAAPALTRLREEGVIRAWGIGVNRTEPCHLTLQRADPDVFLLAGRYTLLDHVGALPLLSACQERGVKIIIGGPFNSGLLAGGTTFDYAPASAELLAKRDRIGAICDAEGVSMKAAALQFCMTPAAVACIIPGGRTAAEVIENARLMIDPIPESFWRALKDQGLVSEQALRFDESIDDWEDLS